MGPFRRLLVQALVVTGVATATVLGTAAAANAAVSCSVYRGEIYATAYCYGQFNPENYPGWPIYQVVVTCYKYSTGQYQTSYGPWRASDSGVGSTAYCSSWGSELVNAYANVSW